MAWVTKDSNESYAQDGARQYTKAEKAANWWHYHKWIVVGAVVAVVAAAWIIKDTLLQTRPDYQVGYVGLQELPVDTSENLAEALQVFGEDLNGDGKVVVQLNQYIVDFDAENESTDAYTQMAGVTRLSADLGEKDGSYIFILQDPASFENNTAALQYLDGTMPDTDAENADYDWQNMVYRWGDCPVLGALELGDYRGYTLLDSETGSNQSVLAGLYVACRGYADDTERADAAAMWQKMTAGATTMPDAAN